MLMVVENATPGGLGVSYSQETSRIFCATSRFSIYYVVFEQDQVADMGPLPGGGKD